MQLRIESLRGNRRLARIIVQVSHSLWQNTLFQSFAIMAISRVFFSLFLIFNNDEYDSQQIKVPRCTFLINIKWFKRNTCRIVLNAIFDREGSKLFLRKDNLFALSFCRRYGEGNIVGEMGKYLILSENFVGDWSK